MKVRQVLGEKGSRGGSMKLGNSIKEAALGFLGSTKRQQSKTSKMTSYHRVGKGGGASESRDQDRESDLSISQSLDQAKAAQLYQ